MFYINVEPEGFFSSFFSFPQWKWRCIAWYCTAYQWCMYLLLFLLHKRLLLTLTSCTWKVYTDVIHLTDWCRRHGHECIKQHVYNDVTNCVLCFWSLKWCYTQLLQLLRHTIRHDVRHYVICFRSVTWCYGCTVPPSFWSSLSWSPARDGIEVCVWTSFCFKQRLFLHLNHEFNKQQA